MDGERPNDRPEKRIAVIGGGITGLAAAHRVLSNQSAARVTVFETSGRLGGIIRTEVADGFLMELGPDSFITNKPGAVRLCEEIGLTDQLIPTDPTYRRSLVLRKGKPYQVPDGFMLMAPAKPWAIMTTPILSMAGKLRLLGEAFVSRRKETTDESLAGFVRRRFGRETLDRLVQPLVGGIYTSDPEKLSLNATLPRFVDMEREYGSVIKATLANERTKSRSKGAANDSSGSGARYGLFATCENGLTQLVDAVGEKLRDSGRVEFRMSSRMSGVQKKASESGAAAWRLQLEDGSSESFDGVIMTLPTHTAASLLKDESLGDLANGLRSIEYASSAIVVSGHRLSDFSHPLDAFGLVIPAIENRKILAVSFSSRKFPGRAPEGHILLRTFVGGAMQPELLDRDDDEMQKLVNDELTSILGMKSEPMFSEVVRYNNAMPQYHLGHLDRVAKIEALTSAQDGLAIAGSAYRGVGIPDSIASGFSAADAVCPGE